ncbi:MAG: zinc-binding alcohol dehydrogenase family protein [Sporomusa sp.]|nr:zinc-binding alcohol dehydrogenase family protein [Sporomusa sp.]
MDSNMQAIVCTEPSVLSRTTRPLPAPTAGQVLIKVQALGICGSDIHAFHGRQPMFSYPQVMGHEISGQVISVGASVSSITTGQQVIVIPYAHCGHCAACRRGKTNCCTSLSVMGVHRGGALQEYIVVDEKYLVAVDGLAHTTAALIEPYAISAHAVRRSGLASGDQVLIVGAGAIGLAAADISRALGAQVILAETNPERLAAAANRYEFSQCLNPLNSTFDQQLKDMTDGNGPVIIIDATGNPASMNSQINSLAAGGTLVFVGLHSGEVQFNDLAFHKRETTLCGSRGATREDFQTVIDLAATGKIRLVQLCSLTVPFNQLDQTEFVKLASPEVIKAVITF